MTRKEKKELEVIAGKMADIIMSMEYPRTLGTLPDGGYTYNAMSLRNKLLSLNADIMRSANHGVIEASRQWDNY